MKIILILMITLYLQADTKQVMLRLYQNQHYAKACQIGFNNFSTNSSDEKFISLYAFACLHSDFIDRLAIPIAKLKYSKEARINSAYFATILMQKKMLYNRM